MEQEDAMTRCRVNNPGIRNVTHKSLLNEGDWINTFNTLNKYNIMFNYKYVGTMYILTYDEHIIMLNKFNNC